MAVIITFLSTYRDSGLKKYTLPVEDEIMCCYTNDAPFIYLSRKIEEELHEEKNIKIVTITSYDVFTKKCFSDTFEVSSDDNDKCRTLYDYYENALVEKKELYEYPFFWKEKTDITVKMCMVPYDFYFDEQGLPQKYKGDNGEKSLNSVYSKLVEFLKDEKYVYIDYSGGLRNVQYLMASLIQFFELSDMQCKQIVYCSLNPNEIVDIKNIYNIGQIVQAVSDFTETGNVKKLVEIYNDRKKYGCISELIESLDRFVKAISTGRADELDDIRKKIKISLDILDKTEKNDSINDLYSDIFMTLVPKIKESFYMKDKESSLSYPNIIKWCLDHRFVQQAATIYVEKMPSIYLSKGIDKKTFGLKLNKPATGNSEDSLLFFHAFWSRLFPTEEDLFAQKLDEAKRKKDTQTFKNIQDLMNCKKITPREKEALDRFIKYLNNYSFSQNSRFGSHELSKNRHQRLRYMLSKEALLKTAYCLINNCNSAKEIEKRFKQENGNSYKLHKETLKKLRELSENSEEYQPLYEIMQYYLAVKIIRNHMNHATLIGNKDIEFINTLTGDESNEISYDKVVEIIKSGLKKSDVKYVLTEDMWKRLTECTAKQHSSTISKTEGD